MSVCATGTRTEHRHALNELVSDSDGFYPEPILPIRPVRVRRSTAVRPRYEQKSNKDDYLFYLDRAVKSSHGITYPKEKGSNT